MKKNELKKSEEKATIYFGVMFLLSLALDFIREASTPFYPWVGGILVTMIVITLILGIKQVSINQELKKEIKDCSNI